MIATQAYQHMGKTKHLGIESELLELTLALAAVFESGSDLIHHTLKTRKLVSPGDPHGTSLPLGNQSPLPGLAVLFFLPVPWALP